MKWILKASASAVLSRLPGGKTIYHKLQRVLGSNRLNFEESLKRSVEIIELIREAGGTLDGAMCLEVGTGWRPFLPIILRLAGAERIITFDVNPWLDQSYVRETIAAVGSRLDHIAEQLKLPASAVRERFDASPPNDPNADRNDIDRLLKRFHIEYRCPGDARRTGLPDHAVDCIVSSNVLEHIPPDVLLEIHRESQRVLKPTGLIAHRFNPQDHFVAVDSSITGANFLKFSQRQWYWLGGSGLAYHNRLRCGQHRLLMERAGFEVLAERVRSDDRAREQILSGRLAVHPDFAGWSAEDLAADYMWLAARPLKADTQVFKQPAERKTSAGMEASSERVRSHELV